MSLLAENNLSNLKKSKDEVKKILLDEVRLKLDLNVQGISFDPKDIKIMP